MSTAKIPGSTRRSHGPGGILQLHFELIRSLMQAPRTIAELRELVDASKNNLYRFLAVAIECGLVHRTGLGVCRHPHVYHWCPVPFEVPASALEADAA